MFGNFPEPEKQTALKSGKIKAFNLRHFFNVGEALFSKISTIIGKGHVFIKNGIMKSIYYHKLTKSLPLLFVFLGLFGTTALNAQNYQLKGTITGTDGQPLIGASAAVEGTGTGTTSDLTGAYELAISPDAGTVTVVFSYLGHTPEKREVTPAAGGTEEMNIVLSEDFVGLEEIVVTGAALTTSKKQYGNAISTLDAVDISNSGALGVDQALAGKVSGAVVNQNSGNPAGGMTVTLRGYSTVVGNSNPLYIVDGVILDNSSPELIDLGGYAQNRLVDLNPNDIERVEIIKGAAAAAIYGSRASNGVVQIFTKRGASGKPRVSFSTSVNMNQLRKEIEENMEPNTWEVPSDPSSTTLVPVERVKMQDHIFSTGYGTDNSLSIRGGTENFRYYASGSAFYNEGIIDNSNFRRYSGRLNFDQVLNDWASVSMGLNYARSASDEIPNGGISEFYGALTGANFNNNAFDPEADEFGNYISPIGFVPNPVEVIETFKFEQATDRFTGNFQLKLTPFEGFAIEYILGYDTYTQEANGFIPIGSNSKSTGWARTAKGTSKLINTDLNFKYSRKLGSRVQSGSWLGFTLQHDEFTRLSITADKLSPAVKSTDGGTVISRGDVFSERNIQGGFFQQTFGFSDKLFLTGAVRLDAASPFGENERSQFYPKASLSYVLSEEPFWNEKMGAVNTFKIRASYGESGNLTALGSYNRFANYLPVPIGGQTGLVPSTRQGNPDLKPERQKELEFGFDMAMLNNRIGLELTYYDVTVEDLLLERSLAASTGFESRFENVGEMTNQGIEVMLRAAPVVSTDFSWRTTVIYSKNTNEVNGIEGDKIALAKSFNIAVARNGEPLGVLDGYYFARDANGEITLDADGLPTRAKDANGDNDRKTIGDPNPDWTGSWVNEFSYKKFSLYVLLDAVQGFDVFNFTARVNSRPLFGGGELEAQEVRGELPRGYNKAAYNIWERFIEDGSFVKLRELTLSYSFQPENPGISNVRFFLQGRNLISFDNYSGWDPEVSTSGQSNGVRGFEFNEVPIPRTYRFGVNLDF